MLFRSLIRNRIGHTKRPARLRVGAAMLAAILLAAGLVGMLNFLTLFEGPPPGRDSLRVMLTPALPVSHSSLRAVVALPDSETSPDAATLSYRWYKNAVLQPSLNTDIVDASHVSKGDTWRCEVTPADGTDTGLTAAAEVTILNSPPTPPRVAIASDVSLGLGDLACLITEPSSDQDNDSVTYSYVWFKDGDLQPELASNVVDASVTSKNDVWECIVVASDGSDSSTPASDEVTVVNTPPISPVVQVTPDSPTGEDALVCHISQPGVDFDGETVTYRYQWYQNGVPQPGLITDTVQAEYTSEGDVWKCVVTASDGTDSSPVGTSNQVTVASNSGDPSPDPSPSNPSPSDPGPSNSAPSAPVVSITPGTPATTDNLACSITTPSTDADGDTITYAYQWYKNSILQPQLAADTVSSGYLSEGDVWKCVVTASDGIDNSPGGFDQVSIADDQVSIAETYFECSFSEEGPEGFKEGQAWALDEPCEYPCEKGVWQNMSCGPTVPTGGTLSIVRDPIDTRRFCLEMALTASGTRPLSDSQHTKLYEIQAWESYYKPFNGAYYYAEYYFPSSMEVIDWRNIMQWGEKGGIGYPTCTITLSSDQVWFTNKTPHNIAGPDSTYLMPLSELPRDTWVAIEVYLEDASGYQVPDGTAIIWINGQKVMERYDVSIGNSPEADYPNYMWGIGNYGSASEAQGQYLLVRNVEVSSATI